MSNWHVSVEEREFHGKPQGQWIVVGWYTDEKDAFVAGEAAWEAKRAAGYEKYVEPTVPKGHWVLDHVDDYFSWRVVTPAWYLHRDGKWEKSLAKDYRESYPDLSGHFASRDHAQQALREFGTPPPRFDRYDEHLRSAGDPYTPYPQ